ncbi:MAG: hypothetical protein A3F13_02605 [Gammaproteobacteria bacterium RIFCSPHIGHO2_12_FULL_40_19]|nr:MAG: hypothetical protein A3F13_02605 [Gammaproteobacteria bacterium RIFCSPHIGHO2_12_FULL_40_19]
MSFTRQLFWETRKSRDSATFTGSYQTLGSALSNAASLIKIVNDSAVDIDISTDGTNDHDFIPANGFTLYDVTANTTQEGGSIFIKKGTQFYVKGSASTGSVYLVAQYVRRTGE